MLNNNYPSMIGEIVEAIHLMYEDNPEVELDCIINLQHLIENSGSNGSDIIAKWYHDRQRCENCGELLLFIPYTEVHTELDGCPIEHLIDWYCPHCDSYKEALHND